MILENFDEKKDNVFESRAKTETVIEIKKQRHISKFSRFESVPAFICTR